MEELKKLLEGIKSQVDAGQISATEASKKMDAITAKMTELEAKQKEMEERIAKRTIPGLDEELKRKKFSMFAVIKGVVFGDWKGGESERDICQQYQRDMGTSPGSAGGYVVPPQVITDIIEMLRAQAVVIKMGASVMDGLVSSPVQMPSQTGGATAYWTAENAAITPSDLTLGQLTMSPKACTALVKLSNQLIKMSNPGAEALVRADIASALALAIDLAALRGSGSGEPLGVANTPSINTVAIGGDGGYCTFDHLLEMEGKLEDNNALLGNLGYIFHGKVKRILKKSKVAQYSGDTAGQYIMLPMSDTNLKDIMGYNFATTSQIPTNLTKGSGTALSEVYLGNWRELLIGNWGGLEIATSNVAGDAYAKNQTWIRAIQEVDIACRHAKSFCLINDAKTV
jgi:HK97 family phage major capsid protein